MPAAFLGHGSPMNALDSNRYTQAWRRFGASVPKPRAVLVISAHWTINASALTAMSSPKTIHDFYGFPQELFDIDYPAPGAPEIAAEVAEIVKPGWIGLDRDSWGIDHGAWSVLVHVFPNADVPVLQLSINAAQDFEYHLRLGAKLAPLRDRGILIVGSGNVVHNLRLIDWQQPDAAFDWNRRFDGTVKNLMTHEPENLAELSNHRDFSLAVPTDEHFIPLLYLAGLAAEDKTPADVLVEGFAMGSLSMTAYTLGLSCGNLRGDGRGASPESHVPGEQTNI
ncbi:4,5-DOPA dioxygenase extradiol [Proteobacteria bacterium 005FR1]|nr:4,5-DOPA dioxygenase extradiol [Proteobacteria bacterium 005FR1]